MNYQEVAERLMAMQPDPIPRYVLMKEYLGADLRSKEMQALYCQVCEHPRIRKIEAEQRPDGSWAPFHGNTEGKIRLLLNAGLDIRHPALKKARDYLVDLLEGRTSTGQGEKQDDPRWYSMMLEPLIAAAMLSLIDPQHELVQKHKKIWGGLAEKAFEKGEYCLEADREAKAEHFGFKVKRPIPPFNYFNLLLLSPRSGRILSPETDQAIAKHALFNETALGYVYNERPGTCIPIGTKRRDSRDFWHWIRALSIIGQMDAWENFKGEYEAFILKQRNEDGLWELPGRFDFILSDRWQGKGKMIDSTIFVMRLLTGKKAF